MHFIFNLQNAVELSSEEKGVAPTQEEEVDLSAVMQDLAALPPLPEQRPMLLEQVQVLSMFSYVPGSLQVAQHSHTISYFILRCPPNPNADPSSQRRRKFYIRCTTHASRERRS